MCNPIHISFGRENNKAQGTANIVLITSRDHRQAQRYLTGLFFGQKGNDFELVSQIFKDTLHYDSGLFHFLPNVNL